MVYLAMAVKRYRYRAYPTGEQARMLARTFGCCRVVFNDFIAERDRLYQAGLHRDVSLTETARLVTTIAKTTPERAWLAEVSAAPLQQAAADAARAYRNFFASFAGKRRGPKMGLPSRKRRSHRQAARFTANTRFKILDTGRMGRGGSKWGKVRLPKIGDLKFIRSRDLPSNPTSVTTICEPDGTYWVSFVIDEPAVAPTPATRVAALDLGLTDLAAVVSVDPGTGDAVREKIPNLRPMKAAARRLARRQRSLARKQKGSANSAKARVRVARAHRKVRDLRADHHHKLAARLIRDHDLLVLETLALVGLGRTRLAKSMHDAGLGILIRFIKEKAENQGRTVARIGRWEPTTQTCSVCGKPGGKKPLHIREWTCEGCSTRLDRDYNAAVNILVAAGLAETLNACGPDIRHRLAGAVGNESGTRRTEATD
ncbi:RNA-guided endonuclease TnpB family protein [Kribbella sp. NPDC051137]|uniref:RNA-guided endonuclease InsQ/TnpB family protein n=1 Tax=Kribbella sp. NPDC051137 TaxID=3155045 RepID=UPI002F5A01B0